jgi:hypothetical protein
VTRTEPRRLTLLEGCTFEPGPAVSTSPSRSEDSLECVAEGRIRLSSPPACAARPVRTPPGPVRHFSRHRRRGGWRSKSCRSADNLAVSILAASPRTGRSARHSAAPSGIRLHIHEDPGLSVSAGDGVFGHLMQGAPGRIRTCAHGSGGRLSLGYCSRSRSCTWRIRQSESTHSPRPARSFVGVPPHVLPS